MAKKRNPEPVQPIDDVTMRRSSPMIDEQLEELKARMVSDLLSAFQDEPDNGTLNRTLIIRRLRARDVASPCKSHRNIVASTIDIWPDNQAVSP